MKAAIVHRLAGAAGVVALISLALAAAQSQVPEHDETAITSVSDHRRVERVAPALPEHTCLRRRIPDCTDQRPGTPAPGHTHQRPWAAPTLPWVEWRSSAEPT